MSDFGLSRGVSLGVVFNQPLYQKTAREINNATSVKSRSRCSPPSEGRPWCAGWVLLLMGGLNKVRFRTLEFVSLAETN